MRWRPTIALVFLLLAALLTALAGTAAAAPAAGTTAAARTNSAPRSATPRADAASAGAGDACSLTGLVRTSGSDCPATGRLRRQWAGIPVIPDPVPIVKTVVGGAASSAIKTVALAAILGWVASGAESALKETAKVIDDTTSPQLTSSWFSASYWRVAAIAALLTLPFLCAAAIHAVVRSDLGLLARAAFGYLPLSLLTVGIASQLTMLLLAGADEMSSIVASASLHADGVFLATTSVRAVADSVATGDPFVTFLAAIITVAATLTLWLELLVRNAAVYVIVLMLPLFFAAMVWPARRTLAIRAIETLIALILSKFAIVAVLSLGGSALGHSSVPGAASVLTGGTLVLLAAFTPWALLRMLPLHEVASAAAGGLSRAPSQALSSAADRALRFADVPAALGAARRGRAGGLDGEHSLLGRGGEIERPSAAATGSEPGRSWAEPVDADFAEPVAGADSEGAGGGDRTGQETPMVSSVATSPRGSETLASEAGDDFAVSAASEPAAHADSGVRWLEALASPGAAEGDDPALLLGEDMIELANQRRLPAAGADDAANRGSTRAAGPPPALVPPMPPTQDAIGPRPADRRRSGAGSEADEPPTSRVPRPERGSDEFGGDI